MSRLVNIGIVRGSHGIRGWVKVSLLTDDPDRFALLQKVFVEKADGKPGGPGELRLEGSKKHSGNVLLKFEGIDTLEDAAKLKGCLVRIPEEETLPITEKDTYYVYQLEGLKVFDAGGEELGILEAVMSASGNEFYVIRSADGKTEYLAPAIKACVKEIDLERGAMTIDKAWTT